MLRSTINLAEDSQVLSAESMQYYESSVFVYFKIDVHCQADLVAQRTDL